MSDSNYNSNDSSLVVDLQEATQAVKENRFADALHLLEISLSDHPDHIDSIIFMQLFHADTLKNLKRLMIILNDY